MSIKRTKREENKELYQKYYRKYFYINIQIKDA